jgi:hypothetical protein
MCSPPLLGDYFADHLAIPSLIETIQHHPVEAAQIANFLNHHLRQCNNVG